MRFHLVNRILPRSLSKGIAFARGLRLPECIERRLPQQCRHVFYALIGFSILMRLPFFFTATDGYMRDAAITFHDEAMFLEQAKDVLRGHLPLLNHWDNATPLQWYVNTLFTLLSFNTLTLFRLLGAVYIGVTPFVPFHINYMRGRKSSAWWGAIFYIVTVSTLQAGQSFTVEHVLGLALAGLMYFMLVPGANEYARARWVVLSIVALACGIAASFMWMLPAVVVLCPWLYTVRGQGRFAVLWPVLVRSMMLVVAAASSYGFFAVLYLLVGEFPLYTASVFEASGYLVSLWQFPVWDFFVRYAQKLANSGQWLVALAVVCFGLKTVMLVLQRRAAAEPFVFKLLLLMLCSFGVLYSRGNNSSYFLFYFIELMPVYALIMAHAVHLNLADLRWFSLLVVLSGLHTMTAPVQKGYAGMLGSEEKNRPYGDRLYHTLDILRSFPLEGETLVMCGEDDMLYPLTGMKNPQTFLFPFHIYNAGLHKILDRKSPSLRAVVNDQRPLYIVGRENDPLTNRGFGEIGDLLQQRYVQVSNIEGTIIYLRKDKLENLFVN